MTDKIASMPKETAAELLYFLAENERFSSVASKLEGDFTVPEVRALLREVAKGLSIEASGEDDAGEPPHGGVALSTKTREVISSLTPEEGEKLLAAFGLKSRDTKL